jgi:hypothetical protein
MPLQRAVERDALADEAFAVVDEQPQIELGPIEVRETVRASVCEAGATVVISVGESVSEVDFEAA